MKSSSTALDRSLSQDSKTIIDIPKEDYVTYQMIGPRAIYSLAAKDDGNGMRSFYVSDLSGNVVGPDKAKIVISEKTSRPRILFKDPSYKEWVEPESFYPFSSQVFYEEDRNVFSDSEGFTIRALKSPVWHGIPNIGIRIKTDKETVVFSSDTVHDTELWEQLYQEKRIQNLKMSQSDFEQASVIYGDINDYIERTWSEERYNDAVNAFNDAVVIHDISCKNSIVHTDYERLDKTVLNKEKVILTHGPDMFTSEWAMCFTDKIFRVKGDTFFEEVNGKLYPMDADIYHKEGEQFYVGYRNDKGKYILSENDGLLRLTRDDSNVMGIPLYRVDHYEDIAGRYFPKIEDETALYKERRDGRVEFVAISENGSRGTIVEDHRDTLSGIASLDQPEKQIVS